MAEQLEIVIGADVSGAQKGIEQISQSVVKLGNDLKGIAPAANAGFDATAQQAKVVQLSVSTLGRTLDDLRQKVVGKQALISTERDVANIAILNKEIQALQVEILRVQNIGKAGFNALGQASTEATDKLVGGFSNAFSALRRLAFILPGIGIAGIFDAAFHGLSQLVDAIGSTNLGINKFKELTDAIAASKDEFVKASVTVATLKDEIQLARDGFISKDEVVRKYNETLGKTTGIVNSLDEAEQALNKNAEAYIRFTLDKAAANVALGKSAELAFQAALQNQKDLERISKITADKEGIGEFIKSGEDNLRKAEQESFQKRIASLNDIADNFLKEAAAISKQFNFNFFDDNKKDTVVKGLDEVQRKIVELGTTAQRIFNVPLKLKFDDTDLDIDKFRKAQQILKEIEDHTIRLKFISLTETGGIEAELKDIQVPKLELKINEVGFKESINALVKGLVIPVSTKLDEPSLLQTEDQIKKVFSGFTDTNIFTEAGRNAGTKFREALLQSVKIFDKGFTINPNIDVTDVIASLTASLAGIKDIQLKVIKTETFDDAIRTLRDLHDAGVEAGNAVEKAFLDAGKSSADAVKAGKAVEDAFGGITKQVADVAEAVNTTLTSAFQDFFKAVETGKNPIKAFFEAIISSVEQVASKLIGSAIEKALLSLITTTTAVTTAVSASATAVAGAAAASVGAAGTAAAAAAGATTAAAAASAAAVAAIAAAAAAKIALASVNPLSLLGLIGLGFAEGGEPPVNQPSIVGEKGWELFVPKVPGTIYSHADSMKLVSNASVKEHESIKEYLIAEKVSQQIKEHFTAAFKSVESSIKVLVTNNERLATYSYHLHESITGLKESFSSINKESLVVNNTDSKSFDKINSSIKEAINVINNATIVNNSASYENLIDRFSSIVDKSSSTIDKSVTIERIINNNFYTSKTSESLKQLSLHELQHTFHIPAFAGGGAVFGPTLAILGEGFGISRSNPEFVGTANQLRGIQGGAFDVNVNVGGELSFSMGKLAIALNREVRSQLRTSGKPPF